MWLQTHRHLATVICTTLFGTSGRIGNAELRQVKQVTNRILVLFTIQPTEHRADRAARI